MYREYGHKISLPVALRIVLGLESRIFLLWSTCRTVCFCDCVGETSLSLEQTQLLIRCL